MKKTLKQIALLPLFCGLLLTVACNKNDDKDDETPSGWFNGVITAVVENGNNYNSLIGKVSAMVEFYNEATRDWVVEEIASGNWSNGGFTLTLPATLDDKFLRNLVAGDIPTGITISDRNAKVSEGIWFRAYNSDGSCHVGSFWYSKKDENSDAEVIFTYADRDVIITSTAREDEIYNVSLKRGWNKIYITTMRNQGGWRVEISTKAVGGLKWHFNHWDDLAIEPIFLNFPFAGGNRTVTVTAFGTWAINPESVPNWLTIFPLSGTGNTQITVTANANTSNTPRVANILFASDCSTATLTVNQAIFDITGVWTLEWYDEDGWYEGIFEVDAENWITIRDTITRRTANSFHVFRFTNTLFGNPQPQIDFNGKEFIYRRRDLGHGFWQVPVAVTLDGTQFFVLDTIILDSDANVGWLDANYEFIVRFQGNDHRVIPVLATFDGTTHTWNTREEWVITPIFSNGSALAAPGAKRAPAVRRTSDRVQVVSSDRRVEIDRTSKKRKR
jgi:hypothetical protein